MTVTFEKDNDVIIYALEKVIFHARRTQQIFVAQCVWWLASIIGLEQGLITYIDNLQSRVEVGATPEEPETVDRKTTSPDPRNIPEKDRQDKILRECEEYLRDSRQQRKIAALKATGRTSTGLINPVPDSKNILRKGKRSRNRDSKESRLVGIDSVELRRRRSAGECLRCTWPEDRKGRHRAADCRRPIKLEKGTASYPKAKGHPKIKQVPQLLPVEEESSELSSFEESSDDSL